MKKYNQLIITLLGFALISGCSSEKSKDTSPPPGYTKLFQGSDSITYLKKMDSWHYQGNSDIIQFEMIISFFKEDTVVGKKFQSIKEKYFMIAIPKISTQNSPLASSLTNMQREKRLFPTHSVRAGGLSQKITVLTLLDGKIIA